VGNPKSRTARGRSHLQVGFIQLVPAREGSGPQENLATKTYATMMFYSTHLFSMYFYFISTHTSNGCKASIACKEGRWNKLSFVVINRIASLSQIVTFKTPAKAVATRSKSVLRLVN